MLYIVTLVAQSVERCTFDANVVGSKPTEGDFFCCVFRVVFLDSSF